jgi:outer membrane protein assembly factor BamB
MNLILGDFMKLFTVLTAFFFMMFTACDHNGKGPDPCGDGEISAADAIWSHGEGDLQNSKRVASLRTKGCVTGPIDTPSVQWTLDLSGPGTAAAPVIGDDGTIYIVGEYPGQPKFGGTRDAGLFALNPNGSIKWFFSRPRATSLAYNHSVAIGKDGSIYCPLWDSTFYALNPNGTIKWSRKGVFTAPNPVIDEQGRIYTASDTVFCFNPDGTVHWFYANTEATEYCVRLMLGRNRIFCSYYRDGILALDYSGNKKWMYSVTITNIPHFGIISDQTDNIYFTSKYGTLISLTENGALRWMYELGTFDGGLFSEPVIRGDYVFVGNSFINRISLQTGVRDSIADLDDPHRIDFWSSILIDDQGTIYGVAGRYVYAFSQNGQKLWRFELPETYSTSFIGYLAIDYFGTLYVTSDNYIDEGQVNKLYALR